MRKLAIENGHGVGNLADNVALLDSRLDSVKSAILVPRLEETLSSHPFTQSEDVHYPVTVSDFIQFDKDKK